MAELKPIKTVPLRNGIKLHYMPVVVDDVKPIEGVRKDGTPFTNDKTDRAQLRQVVKKEYPATQVSTKMRDNLFAIDEFGDGNSYEEARVTWIPVPKGTTKKKVEEMLKKFPQATIYKVLSSDPVLDETDERALENGLTEIEDIMDRQRVVDENEIPVLYHGMEQYRKVFFSKTFRNDVDNRIVERVSVGEEAPVHKRVNVE